MVERRIQEVGVAAGTGLGMAGAAQSPACVRNVGTGLDFDSRVNHTCIVAAGTGCTRDQCMAGRSHGPSG